MTEGLVTVTSGFLSVNINGSGGAKKEKWSGKGARTKWENLSALTCGRPQRIHCGSNFKEVISYKNFSQSLLFLPPWRTHLNLKYNTNTWMRKSFHLLSLNFILSSALFLFMFLQALYTNSIIDERGEPVEEDHTYELLLSAQTKVPLPSKESHSHKGNSGLQYHPKEGNTWMKSLERDPNVLVAD